MILGKKFWEQVLRDYEDYTSNKNSLLIETLADSHAVHICSDEYYSQSSITEQEPLRKLARKFVKQSKYKGTKVGYVSLFSIVDKTKEVNTEIRKDFLNYMIECQSNNY